ncbi:MAG: hypothetical protein ACRCW1_09875, partial [Anaerotignaceae bacterium]
TYTTRTNGEVTATEVVNSTPVVVDLGTTIIVDEAFVEEFVEFNGVDYIFIPGSSTPSVTVENEGQDYVINLVFTRNVTTGGGGGGGGGTVIPDPIPPTGGGGDGEEGTIIPTPTTPTTPTTDIPTTDVPTTDAPTATDVPEIITIEEEETPLSMLPDIPAIIPEVPSTRISEETIEIIEDKVPLGDAPATGDARQTKSLAALLLAAMVALLATVASKKRKES